MFTDTAIFPKRLQYFLLIFHYVLECISLVSDSWGWVFGNLGQRELMDDNTVVYKLELTSHLCLGWTDCDRHRGKAAKTSSSLYLCDEVYPSLLMLSKERRAGAMDVGTYGCMSPSVTPRHTTSLTPWQSLNTPTSAVTRFLHSSHLGLSAQHEFWEETPPVVGVPVCPQVASACFTWHRAPPCVCDAIPECIYSLPERLSELSLVVKKQLESLELWYYHITFDLWTYEYFLVCGNRFFPSTSFFCVCVWLHLCVRERALIRGS